MCVCVCASLSVLMPLSRCFCASEPQQAHSRSILISSPAISDATFGGPLQTRCSETHEKLKKKLKVYRNNFFFFFIFLARVVELTPCGWIRSTDLSSSTGTQVWHACLLDSLLKSDVIESKANSRCQHWPSSGPGTAVNWS